MQDVIQDNSLIIADAHVHIYDCFNLEQFLDSAIYNFHDAANKFGRKNSFQAVLFLTETSKHNYFQQLAELVDKNKLTNWTLQPTQENLSLHAFNNFGQSLFIIAGRQVITEEKLEVLALITDQSFEDGFPLETTIQSVISAGGIPVMPWGVGKWIGRRGKLLSKLLVENNFPTICLGDNSGRPIFWSRPIYFQQAKKQGLRILPGSDPLPVASEASRPGSFGFTIQGSLSREEPGKQLKQMLLNSNVSINNYGSLETPWRFVRNQLAIRYGNGNKQARTN